MNRELRSALLLSLALVGAQAWMSPSGVATAADPTGATKPSDKKGASLRGGALKAGYHFVASSIPALAGYAVTRDSLEVDRRAALGVKRRVAMTNGSHAIVITIGLSQHSVSEVQPIIAEFVGDSQMSPADRFVDGKSRGITLGDQSLVDEDSTSSNIPVEVVFSRANIVAAVQRGNASPGNLKPIAEGIDAAIAALPDVTPAELSALLPVISAFNADTPNLNPGGQSNLTVNASDPGGGSLSLSFEAPDGDVHESPLPRRYQAGSKLGTQNLTLVATNPALLYGESSISFIVTAP